MADTTFTNGVTVTEADWFNTVNDTVYTALGITDGAVPASRAALVYAIINALTADATPDLAADYVTTLDASATTGKKVLLNKLTEFKVASFTRDISTATGTQAVTGTGFKPRFAIFVAGFTSANVAMSVGADTDGASWNLAHNHGASANTFTVGPGASINIIADGSNYYTGLVDTFDTDGFTISWTKTGTTTGTATILYAAIK